MSTVQQIEHAIDALSAQELEELYAWMEERYPQAIDAQLVADLDAGRIDELFAKALAEDTVGRTRTL